MTHLLYISHSRKITIFAALKAEICTIRLQHEHELKAIRAEIRSPVVLPTQQPVPQPESQSVPQSTAQQEALSVQQPTTQSDPLPTSPPIMCPAPKKMKKKTKRNNNQWHTPKNVNRYKKDYQ